MSKGKGMRGYDGSTVPTNRVLRSASYVQVRTVAKVQLRTNSKSSKIRVLGNSTVKS